MNIGYFSNQFASKNGHGIARYANELYHALAQDSELNVLPIAAWTDLDADALALKRQTSGLEILKTGRKATPLLWNYAGFPKIEHLVNKKLDIVHAVSLGYPIATNKPYVVTVHDIGPLSHPQYFKENAAWIMRKSLKQAVSKADAFICVSESTAHDLVSYVKQNYRQNIEDRIHISLEGVSKEFISYAKTSTIDLPSKDAPFILAAGKISPRKNVQTTIAALATVKNDLPHHLITVGGDGWDFEQVKEQVKDLGLQDRVHFMGYVSDQDLKELYSRASTFVYPSLFEGFGLTILEAMAIGCPVISSNRTSLPEVAGDAALLVDPEKISEISDALYTICTSDSLRNELIKKGRLRAQLLNWKNCAASVAQVYKTVHG